MFHFLHHKCNFQSVWFRGLNYNCPIIPIFGFFCTLKCKYWKLGLLWCLCELHNLSFDSDGDDKCSMGWVPIVIGNSITGSSCQSPTKPITCKIEFFHFFKIRFSLELIQCSTLCLLEWNISLWWFCWMKDQSVKVTALSYSHKLLHDDVHCNREHSVSLQEPLQFSDVHLSESMFGRSKKYAGIVNDVKIRWRPGIIHLSKIIKY